MLSFFPRGVLDEILNLIESVSEGFPSYSLIRLSNILKKCLLSMPLRHGAQNPLVYTIENLNHLMQMLFLPYVFESMWKGK